MVGRCGLDSSVLVQGPVVGSCEHGNEPLGSIKGGELRDYLSDYQLFNKDSASGGYSVTAAETLIN